jgi:lipopolysaccharide export system protein LptA
VRFEDKTQGMTLAGASATYREQTGVANVPGPVTFSRGQLAGRGTGAVYDRQTGQMQVLADVQVTLKDDTGGPVDATARAMTFTSTTRSMVFDQQARITRKSEVLSGDRAMLFLSDDDRFFRAIELRGHGRVAPAAGAASTGMPDMIGDDIDLTFHDGTQALRAAALNGHARMVLSGADGSQEIDAPRIDFTTAPDGRTLTDLRAGPSAVVVRLPPVNAAPARTIEAATLAAAGSDQGLLNATFTGAVRFREDVSAAAGRPASAREGRSGWLMLDLDGKLSGVKKATFRQDVTFETKSENGATTRGDGDVGIYDAVAGELELTPSTVKVLRPPRVSDDDVTVDASTRIAVGLNTDSLDAHGAVKTLSKGQQGKTARGFFTPGERIVGSSETLRREPKTKRLRYTGSAKTPARLQQGDSVVEGLEIVADEETGDLRATGQVRSTVVLDAGPAGRGGAPPSPSQYAIDAERMTYVDKERTATYEGKTVVVRRPDGTIQAAKVVITLAPDERRLQRLVATGTMTATLTGGREAKGNALLYDAVADRYTVSGTPVLLRSREKDGTCTLSRGQQVHFIGTEGESVWKLEENKGGNSQAPFSCTEPLR